MTCALAPSGAHVIRSSFGAGNQLVLLALLGALFGCRSRERASVETAPEPSASTAAPSASSEASSLAAPPAASVARPSPCPPEMAAVGDTFCIDRWEASTVLPDGKPHSPYHSVAWKRVEAVSRPGVIPQGYIAATEADAACERAGKRLCTTQEWVEACAGAERVRRTYPYGAKPEPGACNTHRPIHPSSLVHGQRREDAVGLNDPRLNQQKETVAPTGSFSACVTPEGVADLHGNLLEWTRGDQPVLMGGYYLDGKTHGAGCLYVTDGHGPEYHDFTTGFRCCRPQQQAARPAPVPTASATSSSTSVASPAPGLRDPTGMRGFLNDRGKLPKLTPPPYASADAACPVDMVRVKGTRCAAPRQLCLKWHPRLSAGQKIACERFKEPSECRGLHTQLDFCIDRYEFTPPGYTYPITHVNWTEAELLCEAMGKRLCFENEWEFACEGESALPYPYGYERDAERCNHDFPEAELVTPAGDFVDRRVRADALSRCVSPFGVYNLVGNVDEWTTRQGAETPGRAVLRGGWWLIGRNRCRAATANHGEVYAGMQTGFRCCQAVRRTNSTENP